MAFPGFRRGTLPLALFAHSVSALDGQTGVSKPDRAGAGAVGRRAADRSQWVNATIGVMTVLALINRAAYRRIKGDVPGAVIDGRPDHVDTLQTLYFEDLSVGMTERLIKPSRHPTWSASPRSPATAIRFICPSISPPRRRSAPASRTGSLPRARSRRCFSAFLRRHAGPGRGLHFADAEFPRAGEDRRHRRGERGGGRTDAGKIPRAAGLHLHGRWRNRARRRGLGEGAVARRRRPPAAAGVMRRRKSLGKQGKSLCQLKRRYGNCLDRQRSHNKGGRHTRLQSVKAAVLPRSERWTIDWIDVWALALGAIALSLAALIYFADRDPVAVSFVLVAFAAIIGVVLRESVQKREQD